MNKIREYIEVTPRYYTCVQLNLSFLGGGFAHRSGDGGITHVVPGDWVIQDEQGNTWTCNKEEFFDRYEQIITNHYVEQEKIRARMSDDYTKFVIVDNAGSVIETMHREEFAKKYKVYQDE